MVQSLEKRRIFISAMLSRLYGSQIEFDAINFTYLNQLVCTQNSNFILNIQLPPGFPREPPIIRLQSIYHYTEDGILYTEVLKSCPYNHQAKPRNIAEKIVKHILSSIDEFMINSVRSYSYIN